MRGQAEGSTQEITGWIRHLTTSANQTGKRNLMIRQWIPFLLSMSMILGFTGCSGESHVQNPPPPPGSNVSVAFDPAPVSGIFIDASTQITAVVDNDPNNYGVDWLVTCNNKGSC